MPFLSYAQNGEDVVLYRALKDVEKGHYIDVGAYDPVSDSVTKIFYDHGWSGINIEASKTCFERLAAERIRDRNLHVAVSARAGVARFHEVPETGLSTLDLSAAADAERRGRLVETLDVPTLSLAEICRDLPFDTIHFLKIDVEGAESDVLLGADFSVFRPWIVVVEATRPNSTDRTDASWRHVLERADYDCTLFDGLNLYFVAREHAHLRDKLRAPANVLDDFLPVRFKQAQDTAVVLHGKIAHLDAMIAERDAMLAAQRAEHERACANWAAEREASNAACRAERDRAEARQTERDALRAEVQRLTEGLLETRTTLRVVTGGLERELAGSRQELRVKAERHSAELAEAQARLASLAHFQAQSERLLQISEITDGGTLLETRGAELLELRAGLLDQARAWEAAFENLRDQFEDALSRLKMLRASTSWRVTSPLRGISRALRLLLGRSGVPDLLDDPSGDLSALRTFEAGSNVFVSVAARLDGELALLADLFDLISNVTVANSSGTAGPAYAEARLEEQLTRWILDEVARQRRAAL